MPVVVPKFRRGSLSGKIDAREKNGRTCSRGAEITNTYERDQRRTVFVVHGDTIRGATRVLIFFDHHRYFELLHPLVGERDANVTTGTSFS